ncbi:hypothetical protein MBANPS3_002583 [Mucor bainieri]
MKRGQHHRDTKDFVFVKSINSQIPERLACPSCLIHFGDTKDSRTHIAKHTKQTDATTIILNKRSNINSVQSVNSTVILSEVRFLVKGKYEYKEIRSAQVPTIYGERNRWPKIFQVLCYLEMELQKKKLVYEIMENEEQGLITVLPANSLKNKLPTDIE